MIVTGWSDGSPTKSGSGYGIRLSRKNRDKFFKHNWQKVDITFDNSNTVEVSITDSFWRKCTELRSSRIGAWMIKEGLAPWPKGNPPKLTLFPKGEGHFELRK